MSAANQQAGKLQDAAKKIIIFINVAFLLLSLGLLAAGVLLKFDEAVFKDQYAFLIEKLTSSTKDLGTGALNAADIDIASLFGPAATFLLIAGSISTCVCALGIQAGKQSLFILSLPYSILLGIVILLQAAFIAIITAQRNLIDELIKPKLATGLAQGYKGYNETDSTSLAWNLIMVTLSCCGVDGHGDFSSAIQWNRKIYQDGWWFSLSTPVLCCKLESKPIDDFSCAVNPSSLNSNYEKGCYDAVVAVVGEYKEYIMAGVIMLMLVQVILFICSVFYTKSIRTHSSPKDKDEKDDTDGASRQDNEQVEKENDAPVTIIGQRKESPMQNTGFYDRQPYYQHNPYEGAFRNLFRGMKPNGCPSTGVSALLNAMHSANLPSMSGMAGMPFQPFHDQRNDAFNYGNMFNLPQQQHSMFPQNDHGLASVGIRNTSGPVIVQIPALSNTPAVSDSRRSSETLDGPVIEEHRENHLLKRQNTAPALSKIQKQMSPLQINRDLLARSTSVG